MWRALVIQVLNAFRPPANGAAKTRPTSSESYLQELAQQKKARETLTQHLDDLEASLYRTVEREEVGGVTIDWDKLLKGSVMGITHLSLSALPGVGSVLGKMMEQAQEQITGDDLSTIFEAIQRERRQVYRQHIQSLEQFQQSFEQLVKAQVLDKNRQLVVFIDDLDRCLPEKAIEVLEALKLFLDVPGCIFFLGVDRAVIQKGIRVKYQGFLVDSDDLAVANRRIPISGDNYLEKIIQLPFHLLPLAEDRVKEFIEKSGVDLPPGCADIFAAGLEANPRKVKRTLNIFRLLHQLALIRQDEFQVEGQAVEIKPQLLAKVVVIQSRYNELYNHLVETPALLPDLERYFTDASADTSTAGPASAETTPGATAGGLSAPATGPEHSGSSHDSQPELAEGVGRSERLPSSGPTLLEKYRHLRPLRRLLTCGPARFNPLSLAQVKLYLYLTYTTDENPPSTAAEDIAARWWLDLLSHDLSRIKSSVAAIQEDDQATLTEFQQNLQHLLETPDSQYKGLQRFSAGTALALLGDPRNFAEMISIPAGLYGPEGKSEHLEGFKIGKYPVTNLQYQKFLAENSNHSPPAHWGGPAYPPELANHPVTNVNWAEAQAYCRWAGKYLPSSPQWLAACQGLSNQPPPDTDQLEKTANFAQMNLNSTSPVGIFPHSATALGGLDMAGNVWEWTQTRADKGYILKGGAWNVPVPKTITTDQRLNHAEAKSPAIGFRVAE